MIFVDFYGPAETFTTTRGAVREELGRILNVRADTVVIRRIVTEGDGQDDACELWVELSSEEQVFRRGADVAAGLAQVVRAHGGSDVWVMFRVVPLSHAFLNGQPRARGRASS